MDLGALARRFLGTAIVLCSLAVSGDAVALSLSVTPARAEIGVRPGGASTFPIRVSNSGQAPVTLRVYTWDFWHADGKRLYAPPGTQPRSAASWIQAVPKETSVPGGDSAEFLVTVSAPADATGGGYAIVFIQTVFQTAPGHTTTGARMGVQVLARVAGTEAQEVEVIDAAFVQPTETRPAAVRVQVVNRGNVHVDPEFQAIIRTPDGEALGKIQDKRQEWLLPGESRPLTMQWTQTMEPGAYELVGTLLYGDDLAIPVVLPLLVQASRPEAAPPPER